MNYAQHLPVLMYHHVSNKPGLVTLSPGIFRAQMQWLAESGWKTVSAAEVESFYRGGLLPRKSVMLTFDDGYLDSWLQAFPVLQEYGLNAHLFLITGRIGVGPVRQAGRLPEYSHAECEALVARGQADEVMLRWSEVQEMRASGRVEFHPHTHTHKRWDLTDGFLHPVDYITSDILLSRERMKEMLGCCSQHLCWPEGYYNDDYIRVAEQLGFSYLYTTERRMNNLQNGSLRIGRISTKEREQCAWLKRRLFFYTTPGISSLLALHKGPRVNAG
ncbi:TPA: polysaccharide deacetylase family protein [Salmonella enterica subsp. enterica serovar Mississippi]|nr:polysaccharide deacetylase family protein [Salmonella enterica subsp. enterica]ECW0788944.1 polysaccharide deacetylase family protein [Salmonella enterica subsp. enterica]HED0168007.1 polysaccharide deacetylase family protein [Salmonella enterica subsp. enterica serovar Mississippi]HED0173871.1 polysaccharide deacetylase family protein [Salmonella enterica subsp. enterica serovar Mississippi]HED0195866.1 polysaccharide deacetylase family protein [Salmonella enterica subsp. enterica serovar M